MSKSEWQSFRGKEGVHGRCVLAQEQQLDTNNVAWLVCWFERDMVLIAPRTQRPATFRVERAIYGVRMFVRLPLAVARVGINHTWYFLQANLMQISGQQNCLVVDVPGNALFKANNMVAAKQAGIWSHAGSHVCQVVALAGV